MIFLLMKKMWNSLNYINGKKGRKIGTVLNTLKENIELMTQTEQQNGKEEDNGYDKKDN